MPARKALAALPLFLTVPALAQPALFAVRANGDILKISGSTGRGTFIAASGIECRAGGQDAPTPVTQGCPGHGLGIAGPAQMLTVDRWTGYIYFANSPMGIPSGYSIHGMAGAYLILSQADPTAVDLFARIDSPNTVVIVGPTGRTDLESLISDGSGLRALGTDGGGTLVSIDSATGAATVIGGGGFGDAQSLGRLEDGSLVACGSSLLAVNGATGATTAIGPTGFTDIRALVLVNACYVDCNPGGAPPMLNVLDFSCFLNRFASGNEYANCDESTTPPTLNVLDFGCFLNKFAGGCSSC